MNGPIYATTTEEGGIGRIDDGIHIECGDVGLEGGHFVHGQLAKAVELKELEPQLYQAIRGT